MKPRTTFLQNSPRITWQTPFQEPVETRHKMLQASTSQLNYRSNAPVFSFETSVHMICKHCFVTNTPSPNPSKFVTISISRTPIRTAHEQKNLRINFV